MAEEGADLPGEDLPGETGEGVLEESPTSETEDSSEDPSQPEEKPKAKGVQKRIDELTANWREEQRQRQEWEQRYIELQRQIMPKPEPQQPAQPQGEPKLDQYESYEEYVGALADYRADQKIKAWQEQQTQSQKEREAQAAREQFMSRAQAFAESNPDFNSVAFNPALPVSEAMAEAINASEAGPQVLYHLGKHPAEAQRIASLPPVQAALEMGRLEARITAPQPKRQTNAPEPVEPIHGGGGRQTVDPEQMSPEEWLQWRNNQLRSK